MPENILPLSVPNISGHELEYVKECIDTGWVSSAGKYVDIFEQKITEYTNTKYAVACVNGTSALYVSLLLANVKPGDEVIIPTLTFIASVNAIAYISAKPIFMDSDEYYNIDIEKTIDYIENKTVFRDGFTYNTITNNRISAIVPVHVWGNAVWLDELVTLCIDRNISIVEDACESLGTFYSKGSHSGKHTGTIGRLGCLSFNGNKIITSGGGGMILTNDDEISEKARYLTTQAKDDPEWYIHNEIGYNFRLTNIQAALGVAQLEQLPGFLQRKKIIFKYYAEEVEKIDGLSMSAVPDYANNNHWMNLLYIDKKTYGKDMEGIMKKMKYKGIQTRPVWKLNHLQKPYKDCQCYNIEKAEELANNSLCLPSSTNLSSEDLKNVITQLNG